MGQSLTTCTLCISWQESINLRVCHITGADFINLWEISEEVDGFLIYDIVFVASFSEKLTHVLKWSSYVMK